MIITIASIRRHPLTGKWMTLDPPQQIHRDDVEWQGYGELHWQLQLATWQAVGRAAREA